MVVEGGVLVCDGEWRVDGGIVGDGGDDVVVSIEDGDDVGAVIEISFCDAIFCLTHSSA